MLECWNALRKCHDHVVPTDELDETLGEIECGVREEVRVLVAVPHGVVSIPVHDPEHVVRLGWLEASLVAAQEGVEEVQGIVVIAVVVYVEDVKTASVRLDLYCRDVVGVGYCHEL